MSFDGPFTADCKVRIIDLDESKGGAFAEFGALKGVIYPTRKRALDRHFKKQPDATSSGHLPTRRAADDSATGQRSGVNGSIQGERAALPFDKSSLSKIEPAWSTLTTRTATGTTELGAL